MRSKLTFSFSSTSIAPNSNWHWWGNPIPFDVSLLCPWCGSGHLYWFFHYDNALESPFCGFDFTVCIKYWVELLKLKTFKYLWNYFLDMLWIKLQLQLQLQYLFTYIFPPFISAIGMRFGAGYFFFINHFRFQLRCHSFDARRPSCTQS